MGSEDLKYQLINEMPYPLGLLFRNLCKSYLLFKETGEKDLLKRDLFSFGYGFSHFLALLNLKQYLTEDPDRSSNLNKQILQTFRTSHAARWQVLVIQNLTKTGFKPFVHELKEVLQKPVPMELVAPFQEEDTLNEDYVSILTYFFDIPEEVKKEKLEAYFNLAELIFQEYIFLKDYFLVIPSDGLFWLCQGTQPKLTKMKSSVQLKPEDEGQLLLISKEQQYLNLHPFIIFKKVREEDPELHFLHQEISSRVNYIGHGLKSLYLDNELTTGILASYQKMVTSLKNYSLTTRVNRPSDPIEDPKDSLYKFHLAHFVAREPALSKIYDFIAENDQSYGVISGKSGVGKTALLCKLYSQNKPNHFWFFHQECGENNTPEDFYQSILVQLRESFELKFHLPNNLKELDLTFWEITSRCANILKQEEKKLVIFVDGLNDNLQEEGMESVLEYLPKKLPKNTLMILTLESEQKEFIQSTNLFHLEEKIQNIPELSPMEGLGFEAFTKILSPYEKDLVFPDETRNNLFRLTQNKQKKVNPLYLSLLLRCLKDSKESLVRPYRLPKEEQECFQLIWNKIPNTTGDIAFRYLAILSIMKEKGSDALFSRLFHKNEEYLSDLKVYLNPFLQQNEDSYQIFHHCINNFIQEQFQPEELAEFHLKLAKFYDKPEEQEWFQVENQSTFHYLTYHLYHYFVYSKDSKRFLEIIEDPYYNREKERRARVFQYVLDELKYTIKLFLAENNLPKLIRYGFKYNNTKSYREKGIRELPQLLKNNQFSQVLQILKGLDSVQARRLGILYLANLACDQKHKEFDNILKTLIPLSPLGFVLELRTYYIPVVKKLVAKNIPELLNFTHNLPQIHLKILYFLPNEDQPLNSEAFYKTIHQLLSSRQQEIDVALFEALLCLVVTSELNPHFEHYFSQAKKRLQVYPKYEPPDLTPFLIKFGSLLKNRGFVGELTALVEILRHFFPEEDEEIKADSSLTQLVITREEIRKILLQEICRYHAFHWLPESYFQEISSIGNLSNYNLIEIEDLLTTISKMENFPTQAKILRNFLFSLESYITSDHNFKVEILEKIYSKFFEESYPSIEFLVRMCKIYQESARNIQYEYTDPIFFKLCNKLSERSNSSLEKIIQEEFKRMEATYFNQFSYELNKHLKASETSSKKINLSTLNLELLEWLQDARTQENLIFERFPEIILFLQRATSTKSQHAKQVSRVFRKMLKSKSVQQKIKFEYLPLFYWLPQIIRELFRYKLPAEGEDLLNMLMKELIHIENFQKQKKAIEHLAGGLESFIDGDDKVLKLLQNLFSYNQEFEYIKNQGYFLAHLFHLCTKIQSRDLRNTLLLDAKEAIATHPIPEVRYTIFSSLTTFDLSEEYRATCFISSLIEREKIKQLRKRYYYLLGLAHQLLKLENIEKAIEIFLRVKEDVNQLYPSKKKCRLLAELANGFFECFQLDLQEATLEEYYYCALQLKDNELSIDLLFEAIYLISNFKGHPQIEPLFSKAVQTIRDLIQEKCITEQVVILARLGKILVRLGQEKQGEKTIQEGFPLLEKIDLVNDEDGEQKVAYAVEKMMYEVTSTRNNGIIKRVVTQLSEKYEDSFFFRNYGYFQKHRALVLSSFGEAYFRINQEKDSQLFINKAMTNLREIESFDFAGETYILICKKLLGMGKITQKHSEKALTKAITFIKKTPDEHLRYKRIRDFARILTGMDEIDVAIKRLTSLASIASNIYDSELRDKCLATVACALCNHDHLEMAADLLKSNNSAKNIFLPDYVLCLAEKNTGEAIGILKYLTNPEQKWDIIRKLATQFEKNNDITSLKNLVILAVEDHETIDFVFYKLLNSLDDKEIIEELKNKYLAE